jgi:salicylate hydroxylase
VPLADSVQHIIAYPISRGKLINFVAFVSRHDKANTKFNGPWVAQADREEFASRFRRWEPEVQALVNVSSSWVLHSWHVR